MNWASLLAILLTAVSVMVLFSLRTQAFIVWFGGDTSASGLRRAQKIHQRARVIFVALFLMFTGSYLGLHAEFWGDLLGSYFVVTGGQILLGTIGLRFELFSNNPTRSL